MPSRRFYHAAIAWAFLVVIVLSARAQSNTSQIVGKIVDSSGAAVPSAQIAVENQQTGVKRDITSSDTGTFNAPLLPPGEYRVSIRKEGFRPVTQTGVTLQVDQVARLDFTIELGAVSDSVNIVAEAPLLDEQTSSLGQVINNRTIENIPLNGRSPFRLVQLTPGVLSAPSASGQFGDIPVNTTFDSNFSINGGPNQTNEILIDGVPSTTGFFNQITTIPSVDATQEFKVQSSSLSAEYGRFGGGVIDVTTKSGTNEWHGSLFEFVRNDAFDANEFFNNRAGKQKPAFRMNQFGAAVGGPVTLGKLYNGRNRTFFFTDYQGTRWRQGSVTILTLPTGLQRQGNFQQTRNAQGQVIQVYDPATTRPDPNRPGQYVRDPFPNNIIPPGRIDPIALKLLSYYPAPNTAGNSITNVNNFVSNAGRSIDSDQISGRVDQNFGEKYHLFGRIAGNNTSLTQPDLYGNVATPDPGAVGTTPFHQRSFSFDNTVVFSPSLLADFRYGFARWYQQRKTRSFGFDQTTLGYPASLVSQYQIPVFPAIAAAGYGSLGGQSYLNNGNDTHTFLASLTKIRGKQNMKAGIDVRLKRINLFNVGGAGGTFSFTRNFTAGPDPNQFTTNAGDAFASFLLGTGSGSAPIAAGVSLQDWYFAGFVQEDIRLTNTLTINAGFRYETESPYTERRNQLVAFDRNIPSPARNAQFPNLTGGLRFASADNRYVYDWDRNNFAPRAGFAWSGLKRTVVRGGGGIFYVPLGISPNAVGFSPSAGFSSTTTFVGSLDGITPFLTLRNPFPQGLNQPTRNSLGAATFLGQNLTVWDPGARTPYMGQWNLNVQRQFGGSILLDVAYTGSRGIKLARDRQINTLSPDSLSLRAGLQTLVNNPFASVVQSGTLAQPRVTQQQLLLPFPQYTGIDIINSTSGNSVYHALNVKAQKRLSHGVSLMMAYTFGKLISDESNQLSPIGTQNVTSGVQNWYNLRAERAISEADISQQLSLSYVVELPFGPGRAFLRNAHGPVAWIASGWQINGIVSHRGGFPLALSAPVAGIGNRPNSTGKNAALDGSRSQQQKIQQWFDTGAFTIPPAYTLGNVSRTLPNVRGPGLTNLDTSLTKETRLRERIRLEFRAEAFNITNTTHLWMPNTSMSSVQFGQISATTGLPRVMQFALKLMF